MNDFGHSCSVMRIVPVSLTILLILVSSPIAVPHFCKLRSSVIEIPITIILIVVLARLVAINKSNGFRWLITAISPFVALLVTSVYQGYLHSNSFPETWLDKSAIEWKAKVQGEKNQARIRAERDVSNP